MIVEFIEIKSDKLPLPEWVVFFCGLHCKRVPCLFNFKEVIFNTVYTFLIFFSDPNVNIGIKEKGNMTTC